MRSADKGGPVSNYMHRRSAAGYVFLLPGFLFFCFAILIPFFMGFHISFTDWNGIAREYNYVGFGNFATMFRDKRILTPMFNSLKFALLGTVGNNVVALSTALLVNSRTLSNSCRGAFSRIGRLIFFVPVCLSAIRTAFVSGYIYSKIFPALFGIKSMLGQKNTVIPAIVLMAIWNSQGINMLIYYSGLKAIPQEVYEAAIVDGASAWYKFVHVTLPLLAPSFTVCVTLSLTGWLREFATTLAATGGGPSNYSQTMAIYIYKNLFAYSKAGYGQAVAIAFAVVLIIIGQSVSAFFRSREVQM